MTSFILRPPGLFTVLTRFRVCNCILTRFRVRVNTFYKNFYTFSCFLFFVRFFNKNRTPAAARFEFFHIIGRNTNKPRQDDSRHASREHQPRQDERTPPAQPTGTPATVARCFLLSSAPAPTPGTPTGQNRTTVHQTAVLYQHLKNSL